MGSGDGSRDELALDQGWRELAGRSALVVSNLFEANGWTYGWRVHYVPNAEDLARMLHELLVEVDDPDCYPVASSGRLAVIKRGDHYATFLELGEWHPTTKQFFVNDRPVVPE